MAQPREKFAPMLEQMCRRPGLYTGQPSFLALACYLEGIEFAARPDENSKLSPSLSDFGLWLMRRYLIYGSFWNWSRIVLHVAGSERDAFDLLPQLYREFEEQYDQMDPNKLLEELRTELMAILGRDWNSPETRVTDDLRIG
jgi:hypothetical protein